MESITKNRQPPDTLQALVRKAYGEDADRITELGHGWFNVAYEVELADGRKAVLKIAPPPHVEVMTYERGAMATELAALELIRSRTAVPVPAVHFADTSHELCDADWFAMEFIEGDCLGMLPPSEQEAYWSPIGSTTAALNRIRGPHFGPLTGPPRESWREVFLGLVEDVLRDGERRDFPLAYDDIRAAVGRHAYALDEVTEPVFVEWDLWPNNVMVRDGAIVAVIDHERSFWGDPLMEAGFLELDVPGWGNAKAFMQGYGRGPLTPAEQARRRLYTTWQMLVMTIETEYRRFTDPEHPVRMRAHLDGILDQL